MGSLVGSLMNDVRLHMERHRSRPFLNAVMAGCALAAVADGAPSLSERIRVDQILDTLDELKLFDPNEAVDVFNAYCEGILKTPQTGRERAIAAVKAVTADAETAELLVRICLAVAEAKGEKNLIDQIEIVTLCSILDVEPRFSGLYTATDASSALPTSSPDAST